MSFKVSWKLHILSFIISLIFCLVAQSYIYNLFFNLLEGNIIMKLSRNQLLDFTLFLFIIFIPITIVHELLHGVAYSLFGGKVKYGFKGIYAYAQETTGIVLHRTKFLIVLLSPVTMISTASVFIPGSIGGVVLILNLLGSTGDLLMAFYLCRSNGNSYIVDKDYGFDIITEIE